MGKQYYIKMGTWQEKTLYFIYLHDEPFAIHDTLEEAQKTLDRLNYKLKCLKAIECELTHKFDECMFDVMTHSLMAHVNEHENYKHIYDFLKKFIISNFSKFSDATYYINMKDEYAKCIGYYSKFALYEYNTLLNDKELCIDI